MLRRWLLLACAVLAIALAVGLLLPWLARNGYAGETIRTNLEEGRDASALFYTEYEHMHEIESRFEAEWNGARE